MSDHNTYIIKKGSSYLSKITWTAKAYHKQFTDEKGRAIFFANMHSAESIADHEEGEDVVTVKSWF
ncbi:MAG: hypothetical protein ACYDAO_09335 [Thermoplasmataceae archaeon]